MTEAKVLADLDDRGVLTITLNDVDKRNVLGQQLCRELIGHLQRADTDGDVRVVVLTNAGRVFCAGADLSERSTDAADDTPPIDPLDIFGGIRSLSKPVVGRIAGHAVAGGMGLAAACDLSVAVDDAKFGFTEVRIGVAPAIISVICLPKMRHADAADAFLRGNRFLAPEAARLGLINRSAANDELDGVVNEMVSDLLLGGPGALAATKQLLQRVPGMEFDAALQWTSQLSSDLFESDEAQEGMRAFLEKRQPPWI
jgi:methylglutaconyl-CoA hydratase